MSKTWNFRPDQLEAYRRTGYELIPLHSPDAVDERGRRIGKAPYKGWRADPALSTDEALAHMADGKNVGVRLRPRDMVVDVDPRNFKEGDDPLRRLQDDLGIDLGPEAYPRVVTGSGGLHIYTRMEEPILLRDTLEDYQGIEFKALGRQVVAAGSAHPDFDRPYLWDDDPLAVALSDGVPLAPACLIELAKRPGRIAAVDAGDVSPEQLGEMLDGLDPTRYRDHTRWLELMMACHHATAGHGRDEFLEWSTSDPQYAKDAWLIGRRWDSLHADQAGRRITQKTLFKALHDAGEGARIPRASAEDDFPAYDEGQEVDDATLQEQLDANPDGDPSVGPLEQLNIRGYCAVNDNGQFRVYRRKLDFSWPDGARGYWEVQRKGDFLDILSNVRLQKVKGDTVTTVPLAAEWLKWGGRTNYDGVAFDPGGRIPASARVLNLWTDWAVEPKKGDWSLLRRLLLEGLCDGDQESYDYVMDWAAFMVQHPDRQAEVAVVMKGQKGTGKGTFFRVLAEIAGQHGMHISNQHHFTNHFNAHLRDCIFLFADEAMWAGDKRAEGTLKALITEPTIIIEAKGKDVATARNYLHVAMASNEDWVIPASMEDERRFAVFEVSTRFKGNRAFFDALYRQLKEGGKQALLFELKTRDIRGFHPRSRIPQTHALAQQKLQSLDGWDSWWHDSLCRGGFGCDALAGSWGDRSAGASAIVAADDLKDSVERHLKKLGDRYYGKRALETSMGQRLQRRCPFGVKKVRVVPPPGREDLDTDASGRCYAYRLPSLASCRAAFEDQLGSALTWDAQVQDVELADLDADVEDVDLAGVDPLDEAPPR